MENIKSTTKIGSIGSEIVPYRQGRIHLFQGDYPDESYWLPSSMLGSQNS